MSRKRCLFGSKLLLKTNGGEYDSAVTLSYSSAASQTQLTILSNKSWRHRINTSEATWADLSIENGHYGETNVTLSVEGNEDASSRSGVILLETCNPEESKNRKVARINLSQEAGVPPEYTISFVSGVGQAVVIERIDYVVAGQSGYITNVGSAPVTIPGTFPSGTVISYTATTTGYDNATDTRTVMMDNLVIRVKQNRHTQSDYLTITNVTYTRNKGTTAATTENRWMPAETFFTTAGTPLRAGLISIYDYETLPSKFWNPEIPDIHFETNVPLGNIKTTVTEVSGGTQWLFTNEISGYTVSEGGNDYCYSGLNCVSFPESTSAKNIHVAIIEFTNENDVVLATLPVVTETSERDWLRIYSGVTGDSGSSNELYYINLLAASGYANVWVETSKRVLFHKTRHDDYDFDSLRYYNGDATEELDVILPTVISGANGVLQFLSGASGTNGRFNLKIWRPKNTTQASKNYGVSLWTCFYSGTDTNWIDHGEVYMTQSMNEIRYKDFELDVTNETSSGFSLSYRNTTSDSTLTVPSSAITYRNSNPYTPGVEALVNIKCTRYSTDGEIYNTGYSWTSYTITSGNSVALTNTGGELSIDLPFWASLANGSGGSIYDYQPQVGLPFIINLERNQTSANTGYSRSTGITVELKNLSVKDGGVSAKTVTLTQNWSQIVNNAAYIYSVDGVLTNPLVADVTPEPNGQVTMLIWAASGTVISFNEFDTSLDLRNGIEVTIEGQTLSPLNYDWTVRQTGNQEVILRDLGTGLETSFDIGVTKPSGTSYQENSLTINYDGYGS